MCVMLFNVRLLPWEMVSSRVTCCINWRSLPGFGLSSLPCIDTNPLVLERCLCQLPALYCFICITWTLPLWAVALQKSASKKIPCTNVRSSPALFEAKLILRTLLGWGTSCTASFHSMRNTVASCIQCSWMSLGPWTTILQRCAKTVCLRCWSSTQVVCPES